MMQETCNKIYAMLLLTMVPLLYGAEYKEIRLPIALNDEVSLGKSISCDMSYVLKGIEYRIGAGAFSAQTDEPAEMFISEIITAVKNQDTQEALSLAFPVQEIGSLKESEKLRYTSIVSILSPHFANGELLLYYQLVVGKNRIFIFGKPETTLFFGLTISENKEGGFFWTIDSSPLAGSLIMSVMSSSREMIQQNSSKQYQYNIPIADDPNSSSVLLAFNGKLCRNTDYLDCIDNLDKSAAMLVQLYISAQLGYFKEMAYHFTPESRKRYLNQFEAPENKIVEHKKRLSERPEVLFVANADPIYIVFYKKKSFPSMYIQEIIREDNTLRFMDYKFNNFLTQILQSEMFQKNFTTMVMK